MKEDCEAGCDNLEQAYRNHTEYYERCWYITKDGSLVEEKNEGILPPIPLTVSMGVFLANEVSCGGSCLTHPAHKLKLEAPY
jgi:hypothetical protein